MQLLLFGCGSFWVLCGPIDKFYCEIFCNMCFFFCTFTKSAKKTLSHSVWVLFLFSRIKTCLNQVPQWILKGLKSCFLNVTLQMCDWLWLWLKHGCCSLIITFTLLITRLGVAVTEISQSFTAPYSTSTEVKMDMTPPSRLLIMSLISHAY